MIQLSENWQLTQTKPDEISDPSELTGLATDWIPARVPGTVAQAFEDAGRWSISDRFDFDKNDYWYRTTVPSGALDAAAESMPIVLQLDGLATICEVWLNNKKVLDSDNMFVSHRIDISDQLIADNEICLCFRSLAKALTLRRPRPRWKTKLVSQQQLRWFRTSLLGRIPGWTPPVAPVGPWKSVSISEGFEILNPSLVSSLSGRKGIVSFTCDLTVTPESVVDARLQVGDTSIGLMMTREGAVCHLQCELEIDDVSLWWPHTQGKPTLYSTSVSINVDGNDMDFSLGATGFRQIDLDQSDNQFAVCINGQKIFCRGVCWTVNDIVSLQGDEDKLEETLTLLQNAGVNMIRIGGTMLYEQDQFYRLCDELGIMAWQDFMFANMDYPVEDELFAESVNNEVTQTLARLKNHVCITQYCGNSEIEQQAAMLGIEQHNWRNEFFASGLQKLCEAIHPGVPYVPSSPSGGALPFHTHQGVTHYYGAGAYLRPVSEVRNHDVKFTSESLGFANVPVASTRNKIFDGQLPALHDPRWKERTPRDTGAGWDFEDVRDHYLESVFGVDPVSLRSYEPEKYLALSELVSGEIMSQVFAEWRSVHSQCQGGLVWFAKDLWPGAGWGIIDSHGIPKACYYYLKRVWQPLNVLLTNETLNGLHIHAVNEADTSFSGSVELSLLNRDSIEIIHKSVPVTIAPNSTVMLESDKILGSFYDTTYSYRFGPPKHLVAAAVLKTAEGRPVSDAFYFPASAVPESAPSTELKASLEEINDNSFTLVLESSHFLYAVNFEVPGFTADDNYFHLLPNTTKKIALQRSGQHTKACKGYVSALNMKEDIRIKSA